MIQAIMLIALGFLAASLIGVLIAPSLWNRASRLSKKKLESTLPLTLSEIEATQDQLRASYAVRLRRLETALASTKQKAANQLVDNSRLQMQIAALKDQIGDLDLKLSERRNAATVLEQTITKRFPELDREITAVKAQLQERSYELHDLTNKLARRDEELAAAQRAATSYQDELTRLRQVLEKSSGERSGRRVRRASQWDLEDYRAEYDRLNLELSKLRQQLAQFQDRDAQQVGVIKGELQKLAELILTSAQPKAVRQPERPEPAAKRLGPQDARRERPAPWLQGAKPPMPLTARLKLNAKPLGEEEDTAPDPVPASSHAHSPEEPIAAASAGSFALSPVLTMLQEETVLTSALRNGNADGGARPKILQEVVTANTARHNPEERPKPDSEAKIPDIDEPHSTSGQAGNGTAAEDPVASAQEKSQDTHEVPHPDIAPDTNGAATLETFEAGEPQPAVTPLAANGTAAESPPRLQASRTSKAGRQKRLKKPKPTARIFSPPRSLP